MTYNFCNGSTARTHFFRQLPKTYEARDSSTYDFSFVEPCFTNGYGHHACKGNGMQEGVVVFWTAYEENGQLFFGRTCSCRTFCNFFGTRYISEGTCCWHGKEWHRCFRSLCCSNGKGVRMLRTTRGCRRAGRTTSGSYDSGQCWFSKSNGEECRTRFCSMFRASWDCLRYISLDETFVRLADRTRFGTQALFSFTRNGCFGFGHLDSGCSYMDFFWQLRRGNGCGFNGSTG